MLAGLKKRLKPPLERAGLLRWYYDLYPQRPLYVPSVFRYLLMSRWVIYGRLRLRMLFFLLKSGFKISRLDLGAVPGTSPVRHLDKVLWHNLEIDFSLRFSRHRVEHMIYVLRSILSLRRDGKTLVIGPKNEGELLLLEAHGFTDVTAIDIHSYSPRIQLMDMHQMTFPDSTFDLVSAGYTIRYSYDAKKFAQEVVRVAKNGALVALSFSGFKGEPDLSPGVGTMLFEIDDLLALFKTHVDYVYFRLEDENTDESILPHHSHIVVFKIKK